MATTCSVYDRMVQVKGNLCIYMWVAPLPYLHQSWCVMTITMWSGGGHVIRDWEVVWWLVDATLHH